MKYLIWLIKKTELLSALSIRLVYITGKSKVPIHPKHLIRTKINIWYKKYLNNKTVLVDAGCGSGQHSLQISKYVKKIIGLDNNWANLKIAKQDALNKKITNADFVFANLEKKIPLKNNLADVVILFDILEHINRRKLFLGEIRRILKKRGIILVAIPNNDTSWKKLQRKYGINSFSDPDHKIEYTKETIKKQLEEGGFKIISTEEVSYDTPWIGFIDLIGGISLNLYRKISKWKQQMLLKHPENCSGYQIVARSTK